MFIVKDDSFSPISTQSNKDGTDIQIQIMKLFGLFTLLLIISFICVAVEAKRVHVENDDDVELSDFNARSFLEKYDDNKFDTLMNNPDCVLCKFNKIPCCKPNLCIKKRFRPDECLELKPR
ncbi:unnamed protein product [Rotaria magnacalcarata]|uniref:Uncharacterized protein n=1 Tax=Rotaria magnacalcarata TaxID=392030 RepID=A0A814J7P7_9BILA|nr:unnamed protein product [Rotaria magnacalcarata]